MRIPLILAFIFLSASLPAQFLSLDSLQGTWKAESIRIEEDEMAEEEYPARPNDNIWIFEGDTLKSYYYPYKLLTKQCVRLDSNRLFRRNLEWSFAWVELDSGKLLVHLHDFLLTLKRTDMAGDSLHTIRILDKDRVNPGALLFTFEMVTHFVPDDAEAYDFKPPVRMPKRISFSDSAEARAMIQSGTIYLKAGGKKEAFTVEEIGWDYFYYKRGDMYYSAYAPYIAIYPKDWARENTFRVIYRAREKDVAKRERRR